MSGSGDKAKDTDRGTFLDAIRNRTVTTEIDASLPRGLRVATAYARGASSCWRWPSAS